MAKILIIDDSLSLRIDCRDYLKSQNYDVEDVSSGMEALSKLKKNKYDLIITDNQMTGIRGLDLIPILMNSGAKIIFMSGAFQKDIVMSAAKLGVSKFLCKNFTLESLDSLVTSCLYEKMMEDEEVQKSA